MKRIKLISIVSIMLLYCSYQTTLQAQVAIGNDTPPEKFAILQIDGEKQGLRLTRLGTTARNNLPVTSDAAGLVIYNTDTKQVEFYDGSKWRGFANAAYPTNAVTTNAVTGNLELGGKLTKDTEINLNNNSLDIKTGSVNNVIINNDDLSVNDINITSNVNSFAIKDGSSNDVFKIEKQANNKNHLNASAVNFNIGNVLKINNDTRTVSVTGGLTYPHSSRGDGKVLISDADGNTSWKSMVSSTQTKAFRITKTEGKSDPISLGSYLSTSNFEPITDTLHLHPGKWFISGTIYLYTYNVDTRSPNTKSTMIKLSDNSGTTLYLAAEQPEAKNAGTGANTNSYTAISIRHVINVPQGNKAIVKLEAKAELSNTYMIRDLSWLTGSGKGSTFHAIRVND